MKIKKKRENPILIFLLALFLCLQLILTVGVMAGGIFLATLDTGIDEAVFFGGARDKTTRLYYYNNDGEATELASDRISGYENALYCSLEEMSPYLSQAFVAIEDKRFWRHGGIDWARTVSATKSYLLGGSAEFGGSTITQQLVKNLTGESKKSVRRKLSELIRAAKIEKLLSKKEILEQYLNIVNLSENCYGVRTAANAYFSKEPRELTLREAASIAAITNNPARYNPIRHPDANRRRRDVILAQMLEQGMISKEEHDAAIAEETELHVNDTALSGRVNSWYADLVVKDVIAALVGERGMSEAAASRLVYCGGLKIYTAVNLELQELVAAYYENPDNFPTHEGQKKAQSAMMILDPHSGDILAVAGAVGKKQSNRIQNFATDAKRPSGSVIKPLAVYAPALQKGYISWATVFDDTPQSFKSNGAPWPRNAPDLYRGLTTVSTALTESVNTVSLSILDRLGRDVSFQFLKDELSFTSLDRERDSGAAALALGQQSIGVTLSELLGGYTALANHGVFVQPRSFYLVLDADDRVLLSNEGEERSVLDSENAEIMTMLLRRVVQSGTAKSMTLKKKIDVAGKTGTSNNSCDKWFIGYTPELLAGVWYGHEYPEALSDVKGNPALNIFDELMTKALEIVPVNQRQFSTDGELVAVRFCRDSGHLPGEACRHDPRGDRTEIGYFKKGSEPQRECDRHVMIRYCELGGVAGEYCPEECCHTTALLRVSRHFPRQVRVLDAPYTYGGAATQKGRVLSYNEPYYAVNHESKQNFGIGIGVVPYNRLCLVHGEDDFWSRRGILEKRA